MTFPSSITLSGGIATVFTYDSASSSSTKIVYNRSGSTDDAIQFVPTSNGYEFSVNDPSGNGDPISFKTGASGSAVTRSDGYEVTTGTLVWLYQDAASDYMGNFTVGSWSGLPSGGTGSSGNVSVFSAVFSPNTTTELRAVITRQGPAQYEGGTPHISLFDENVYLNNPLYTTNWPTGGTTMSQTFSSLYNFTLDPTKTYYVATAQGTVYATSTPESRRAKKVFCNFW